MARKKVDLKFLPAWLQSLIVLSIVTFVAIAGYLIGRDRPVPLWIDQHLIPGLGWFGLALIAIVTIDWLKNILMAKND